MLGRCDPPRASQTQHTPRHGTGRIPVSFTLVTKRGAGRAVEPWKTHPVPCQGVHVERLPRHDGKGSRDPSFPPKSEYARSRGAKETENASFGTRSCHGMSRQSPPLHP